MHEVRGNVKTSGSKDPSDPVGNLPQEREAYSHFPLQSRDGRKSGEGEYGRGGHGE